MHKSLQKCLIYVLILTLITGNLYFGAAPKAEASVETPDLLITEIVANSHGSGQPFEYVEIYNNTSADIDLHGYELQYFTSNMSNPANRWTITDKTIKAKGVLVLWLKKFNDPDVPLWDFNSNYDVFLTPEEVFEVKLTTAAQGLHDSALRKVGIAGPNGVAISTALINDGQVDGLANRSVIYQAYGSDVAMSKIRNNETPTPGHVVAGQVPGPTTPSSLTAQPGDQYVHLTWDSSDSSAAEYKVYFSDYREPLTVTEAAYLKLENLNNDQEYRFRVTAVDAEGNESPATQEVRATPQEVVDFTPPSMPTGVQATPEVGRIHLSWQANGEADLAGYRVYINGTIYDTVSAASQDIAVAPLELGREYTFEVTAYDRVGNESEKSEAVLAGPMEPSVTAIPPLLITELVPDTHNFASYDAFEYLELYNNSDTEIDLQGYRLRSGSWNVEIEHSLTMAPWETTVFWTRRAEIEPLTVDAFNSYYFSSYASKYIPEERLMILGNIGGLVNSNSQTVTVFDPYGNEVVQANYTGDDVSEARAITFTYPEEGSLLMRKMAAHQTPTPGWIVEGQAPPREQQHTEAPQAPTAVTATSSGGKAFLSWAANAEADIYRYHIYKNGQLEHSVPAQTQEFTVFSLLGNKEYVFEVTAEDTSGNMSSTSEPIASTPTHQVITQEERVIHPHHPNYQSLWEISEDGPVIPGLAQDLVPQGITYYADQDWLLSISYLEDGRPATLSMIDATSEELVKSVLLYNADGTPYTGHAGGITVSKQYAWVASEEHVYQIKLSDLVAAGDNEEVRFVQTIPVPVHAAYNTMSDGVFWVGEFYESKSYPTDSSHHLLNRDGRQHYAWLVGYKLDEVTDELPATPDYILSTTEKVQGAVIRENEIILSTSYGRGNDSVLYRYHNPLQEPAHHTVTVSGQSVPIWFLDNVSKKEHNSSLTIVPMSEGIVAVDDYLYVNLESGANKYRFTSTYPMDRMLKIDLHKWEQSGVGEEEPEQPTQEYARPELLVTELHPNNKGTDDYEFFEVYNNSTKPLTVGAEEALLEEADYYLMFRYPSAGTSDRMFNMETVTIPPQGTHVFWINPKSRSLEEFNTFYDVQLTAEQISEIAIDGVDGFSNSADRAVVMLNKKTGLTLVQASYTAANDISDGGGVHYQAPLKGSIHQEKYLLKAEPTPGSIFPEQITAEPIELPEPDHEPVETPRVLISQFLYDATGSDDGKEYIVIKNYEEEPVDISGYMIGDGMNQGSGEGMAAFPEGTIIQPGQEIVLAQSGLIFKQTYGVVPDFEYPWIDSAFRPEDDPDVPDLLVTDWSKGVTQLANGGDKILLMNPDYQIVDFVPYLIDRVFRGVFYKAVTAAAPGNGHAIHRVGQTGDLTKDFVAKAPILPERAIPTPTSSTILITEVMYTPNYDEPLYEYVEITNIAEQAIDISGYYLGDKEVESSGSSEGMFNFPDNTIIEPYEVIVIAKNARGFEELYGLKADFELDGYEQGGSDPSVPNMIPNCAWGCGNMQFGNTGDEVLLLDRDKHVVDVLVYKSGKYMGIKPHAGVAMKGYSLERISPIDTKNPATDFVEQPKPTPGVLLFGPNGKPELIPSLDLKDKVLKVNEPQTALIAAPTVIHAAEELPESLATDVPSYLLKIDLDDSGNLLALNWNIELSKALDKLQDQALPILEINRADLVRPVDQLLEQKQVGEVMIVSTDAQIVREMSRLNTEYRGAVRFTKEKLSTEELKEIVLSVRRSGGFVALIDQRALTPEIVRYLHGRAITVWGYGVKTEIEAHRLIALGVAGIETVKHEPVVAALGEYTEANSITQAPIFVAHRGMSSLAPEDTLPAFELAAQYGAELVEIDIHLSKDGVPVVIHDFSVDRTTNGTGKVRDLTLAELKQLTANKTDDAAWQEAYNKYPETKISTLDEVLQFFKGKNIVLQLEIKGIGVEEKVVQLIEQHDLVTDVYVTSFSLEVLERIAALNSDIGLMLILSDRGPLEEETLMQYVEKMASRHVSLGMYNMSGLGTKEFIDYAKHRGIPLVAATANSKSHIQSLMKRGVNQILTDYPQWMEQMPVAISSVPEHYQVKVGESVTLETFESQLLFRAADPQAFSGGIRILGSNPGIVSISANGEIRALQSGSVALQLYHDVQPFNHPVAGDSNLLTDMWRMYSTPITLTVGEQDDTSSGGSGGSSSNNSNNTDKQAEPEQQEEPKQVEAPQPSEEQKQEDPPRVEVKLNDISGHWAEDSIKQLAAIGAIQGYTDGTFKPNNPITRAEFVTLLVQVLGLEKNESKVFKDTATHWAKEVISTAYAHGIVQGYDEVTFGPNELISREQMAVMIIRALAIANQETATRFQDHEAISEWAKAELETAIEHGIFTGYQDSTIQPKKEATRAEAVTVLLRALNN